MSPFIVTTTRREGRLPGKENDAAWSRRAVATLEDARRTCISRIAKCAFDAGTTEGYQPHEDYAKALTESGGTVGPLPDGTVIEVERKDKFYLADVVPHGRYLTEAELLAAFNAKQAT